jgi:hypothetical protein
MLEDSAFEDDSVLEALRYKPWEVYGCVYTYRGESSRRLDAISKSLLWKRAKLDINCKIGYHLHGQTVLTFGTVSLNHGFGDSSSANQSAVGDPTSLARLRISHSGLKSVCPDGRRVHPVGKPWKCTPASGWFCAKSSSGAQVFLSHSAACEPRTETLQ